MTRMTLGIPAKQVLALRLPATAAAQRRAALLLLSPRFRPPRLRFFEKILC
jgi:hypothetical protein